MNLEKTLISSVLFIFSVLLFPTLDTAIQGINVANPLRSFMIVIPPIFVLVTAMFPVYYLLFGGVDHD